MKRNLFLFVSIVISIAPLFAMDKSNKNKAIELNSVKYKAIFEHNLDTKNEDESFNLWGYPKISRQGGFLTLKKRNEPFVRIVDLYKEGGLKERTCVRTDRIYSESNPEVKDCWVSDNERYALFVFKSGVVVVLDLTKDGNVKEKTLYSFDVDCCFIEWAQFVADDRYILMYLKSKLSLWKGNRIVLIDTETGKKELDIDSIYYACGQKQYCFISYLGHRCKIIDWGKQGSLEERTVFDSFDIEEYVDHCSFLPDGHYGLLYFNDGISSLIDLKRPGGFEDKVIYTSDCTCCFYGPFLYKNCVFLTVINDFFDVYLVSVDIAKESSAVKETFLCNGSSLLKKYFPNFAYVTGKYVAFCSPKGFKVIDLEQEKVISELAASIDFSRMSDCGKYLEVDGLGNLRKSLIDVSSGGVLKINTIFKSDERANLVFSGPIAKSKRDFGGEHIGILKNKRVKVFRKLKHVDTFMKNLYKARTHKQVVDMLVKTGV